MKTTLRLCICALVLTGLCITAVHADEPPKKADDAAKKPAEAAKKVENPAYKHWSQFKPGAFSVVKMKAKAMGMDTEVTMTQTLKKITPEKAVVEMVMVQKMMGQESKMPPQTKDVLAKVSEAEAKTQTDPEGKVAEGEETLTILGKKIKTKWMEMKLDKDGMKIATKTWTSEDIPGQLVKVETRSEGGMPMSSTGELVEFGTKGKPGAAKKAPAADAKKTDKGAEKDGETPKKTDKGGKKDKP